MPVFQLPPDVLRVGEPTPFALRDRTGCLLVPRGTMVASETQRQQLAARDLYVDEQDGEALKRAIAGKLDSMVRQNALIGAIAQARPDPLDVASGKPARRQLDDPLGAWSSLQLRISAVLHDPGQPEFEARLLKVQAGLLDLLNSDVDSALLPLVHGATREFHDYSVRHAMLVAVACERAARHVPIWDEAIRPSLRRADDERGDDAKAVYLDEFQKADEAGSAIIKAIGLYPPGCLVKLRSGEMAVVLRQGKRSSEPVVASIVNTQGHAIAEPPLRNTALATHEVVAGVAAHEAKVNLNLDRLLKLA